MLSPCPWVQEQTKYIKLHRWEPLLRPSELPTENLPFIQKSHQLLSVKNLANDIYLSQVLTNVLKHFGVQNSYQISLKIMRHTTGARGYKFELFQSIFSYIEQFSQSILLYLFFRLSLTVLDYLGLSRIISDYLGLSWTIWDYL